MGARCYNTRTVLHSRRLAAERLCSLRRRRLNARMFSIPVELGLFRTNLQLSSQAVNLEDKESDEAERDEGWGGTSVDVTSGGRCLSLATTFSSCSGWPG